MLEKQVMKSLKNLLRTYNFFYILFILLIVGIFLLFQKEVTEDFLESELSSHARNIQDRLEYKTRNVENNLYFLFNGVTILEREFSKKTKIEQFIHLTASIISRYPEQYNAYFAFEKKLSQKYNKTDGYILTTQRNSELSGTKRYSDPTTFISKTWTDPKYQFDESEIWYHIAKKAKGMVFSRIYFDNTYMKKWLITAGQGIYVGESFEGMVGVDILLDDLTKEVSSYNIGKTGGAFLYQTSDKTIITDSKLFGLNKLDKLPHSIAIKTAYFHQPNLTDDNLAFIKIIPLKDLPWSLVVYQGYSEIYAKLFSQIYVFALILISIIIVLILIAQSSFRKISNPIKNFVKRVNSKRQDLRVRNYINLRPSEKNVQLLEIAQLDEAITELSTAVNENFERYQDELSKNIMLNNNLDLKVQKQTHHLNEKNQELEKALDELRSAQNMVLSNEKLASIGNMTAGVAHEIKNPVYIISNCLQVISELMHDIFSGESKNISNDLNQKKHMLDKMLETSIKHCERINNIISNMLSLTRGESQTKTQVALDELVNSVIDFSYAAFKTKYKFECQIDRKIEFNKKVFVYKDDLSRVIVNIIDNALFAVYQAYKSGVTQKPRLEISLIENNNEVILSFIDNGIGIPEDILKKVFDPFFTTKKSGEGTGLGLSIARDVVIRHGGELEVKSEVNLGTTFYIKFKKDQLL